MSPGAEWEPPELPCDGPLPKPETPPRLGQDRLSRFETCPACKARLELGLPSPKVALHYAGCPLVGQQRLPLGYICRSYPSGKVCKASEHSFVNEPLSQGTIAGHDSGIGVAQNRCARCGLVYGRMTDQELRYRVRCPHDVFLDQKCEACP